MNKPKKGGAGLGQGRKPKSGKYIQFRPSVEVWNILKDKPKGTVTAFIEESVVRNHYIETQRKQWSNLFASLPVFCKTSDKEGVYKDILTSVDKKEKPMTFDTMKSDLNKLQEDLKNDLK